MNNCRYVLVLCFGVILSARLTMGICSFELQTLMNNIDNIKDKLQEVGSSLKETEHRLQEKLTKHENSINEKIDMINAKMEKSLNKSVEVTEENTRTKLEELKYHMTSKIDHIQESSQTELQKLGENKEILDMLTNSLHNLITKAEVLSSLQETEDRLQEKLTKHENNINEKIETINAKMHAMEEYFNKSVEASEENTRINLEEVKNQLISRIDNMLLQLTADTKTIQKKTQTELKQLGENKNNLDNLTNSVRNISIQGKHNTKMHNFLHPVSSCRKPLSVSDTYIIHVAENSEPLEVLCGQHKIDGDWIVIQHRYDGSVDFYRNWTEYRNGFGTLDGEFWLGLEYIHQITKNRSHELLVEMKDFHGNYGYAKYDEFEIGNESELYALKKLGTHSGTAGDSMTYHKYQKFSTFDRDNDEWDGINCAEKEHGAWWYRACSESNFNGRYQNTTNDYSAMMWYDFHDDERGLSYSRMMIRDIID